VILPWAAVALPVHTSGQPPGAPAVAAADADRGDAERRVLFHRRSPLQDVFVVEEDGERVLRFDRADGNDQSALDPARPDRLVFEYVRLATLATVLAPRPPTGPTSLNRPASAAGPTRARFPARALVVGLGGGAFPGWLVRRDPRVVVDVAEIDPVVVDAARRFFALPATPRLAVHVDDGARFLARARAGYDVVLLDAFSGDGIPPTLSTPAFFGDVRRVLADDGIAVLNIALVTRDDAAGITARFARAFPACVVVHSRREDNLVVFGARHPLSVAQLEAALAAAPDSVGLALQDDVGSLQPCP
jgi:spermidine synthase